MAQSGTMPSLLPQVQEFVDTRRRMLIDGTWGEAASGKTFPVYDPATEAIITHTAEGEAEDIDRAVRAARQAFDEGPWRKVTPSERGRMLWRLGDLIESHAEGFAQLESLNNGKPLKIARVADIPLAVDMFRYMAGWATKVEGHTIPISALPAPQAQFLAYTRHEPISVVGQIIPWNFPLLMAVWKPAPAPNPPSWSIPSLRCTSCRKKSSLVEKARQRGMDAEEANVVAKVTLYHEFLQMPYPTPHNGQRHASSCYRMNTPLSPIADGSTSTIYPRQSFLRQRRGACAHGLAHSHC
jgi:acyl-CoA reductase-like NAD-dependent aldehyde dehydrogenase